MPDPPKQAPRKVLGYRLSLSPLWNLGISMSKTSGGNENCGAWWEPNPDHEVPDDQVSTLVGVEIAQGSNGAGNAWVV